MSQGQSYRTHKEILEGIRGRQPAAFDAFFDRHADLVYGFAMKLTGSEEASRRILLETFADVLPSLDGEPTEQAIDRLILREASQRIRAQREDGKTDEASEEIPMAELTPDRAGGRGGSDHDWSLDPHEEERRPEEKRLLRELIVQMPPRYAHVLVLVDMEEMTEQDAADILQISVPTTRKRLHRARLLLRRELTRKLLESGPGAGRGKT